VWLDARRWLPAALVAAGQALGSSSGRSGAGRHAINLGASCGCKPWQEASRVVARRVVDDAEPRARAGASWASAATSQGRAR